MEEGRGSSFRWMMREETMAICVNWDDGSEIWDFSIFFQVYVWLWDGDLGDLGWRISTFGIFWWGIWNYIMGEAEGSVLGHLMCREHYWLRAFLIDGNTWSTCTCFCPRVCCSTVLSIMGYGTPQEFERVWCFCPRVWCSTVLSMRGYGASLVFEWV